jgi:hypothetical protein
MQTNFGKRFRLRMREAHAASTPFIAILSLPTQKSASGLNATSFPGLIATHVAVDREDPRLVSYWKTREDYERSGVALAESVAATEVVTARHVAEFHEQHLSLWKRIEWHTAIGIVLALVGALDGIRLVYNRMNARPDVILAARSGTINYLADDSIEEPLSITNRIPVEQRIQVVSAQLRRDSIPLAIQVAANPRFIPELTENQTEQIRFRTSGLEPGSYQIVANLNVRAGWFQSRSIPSSTSLTVWSFRPRQQGLHISKRSEVSCQLEGDLLVGSPATGGVTCRIRIARHPEISQVYTTGLHASTVPGEQWQIHGEKGAEIGSALFGTSPIAGFKRQRFGVEIQSNRPTNWDNVLAATEVAFDFQSKEVQCPGSH